MSVKHNYPIVITVNNSFIVFFYTNFRNFRLAFLAPTFPASMHVYIYLERHEEKDEITRGYWISF